MDEPETRTTVFVHDDEKEEEKWDCETVLTTYSNIYNHPKLIATRSTPRIRLSNKTGLPLVERPPSISSEEEEEEGRPSISFERKKDETSEERRARKHAVKDMRRVRYFYRKESVETDLFVHLGSSSGEESHEDRFQTRRTETITRTSSALDSSTSAESSCHIIRRRCSCCFPLSVHLTNKTKAKQKIGLCPSF